MPITIGSNIASLQAQRRLNDASASTSTLFERLSSGMRIVRPSDDAAGLAIADDLKAQTRVYSRAILNANDGQSVLSLADSALSELSNIVVRIRELSEQSANGTYSNDQRKGLDAEAQALAKEYFRISRSTSFNKTNLFDGSMSDGLRLQVGYGTDGSLQSRIGGLLGTGTFGASTSVSTEATLSNEAALGDLNGDGILDLVTVGTNGAATSTTIRLGDGSGSFGAANSFNSGTATSINTLTLGDVNGDGVLDLVTAGMQGVSSFSNVFIGNGNGTFQAAASYANTATTVNGIALGDLNGDGILDLVSNGDAATNIRFGTGNGSFSGIVTSLTTSINSFEVALGDLNNDGILDIITAGNSAIRNSGSIMVFLGTGGGLFSAGTSYSTGANTSVALSLGDLNGDGILDIVTSGSDGAAAGTASVHRGTGTGTFGTVTTYAAELLGSKDITLGDVNGDGNLDMISAGNAGVDGYTTIRLGTSTGTFGAATSYLSDTKISYGVVTGDINSDGVLDIVTAGQTDGNTGSASMLLGRTRDGVSPILPFSLKTKADALQSMGMLDRTLTSLSQQRGVIGSFQSRLNVATNVLRTSRDNFAEAESRVRDVDVATSVSELIRVQILQKAATAILAQANQLPQMALQLLR